MQARIALPPEQTAVDWAQSAALGRRLGAYEGRCWDFSAKALLRLGRDWPGAVYVEGWAVLRTPGFVFEQANGLVMAHGWVERPGMAILDVTARPGAHSYFRGLAWTWAELRPLVRAYDRDIPRWRQLPAQGFSDPRYEAAYVAAYARATASALSPTNVGDSGAGAGR